MSRQNGEKDGEVSERRQTERETKEDHDTAIAIGDVAFFPRLMLSSCCHCVVAVVIVDVRRAQQQA